MCGRFTLAADANELAEYFGLDVPADLPARFNIAPTQTVPVVRNGTDGGLEWAMVRWGLVPGWAKDLSIGNRLINARAETVAEKPAFRGAFRRRRCLIPSSGFYEWQGQGTGQKQPYWIGFADQNVFAFAGLWERWTDPESGESIDSCSIITTQANGIVAPIHARMPVVLSHTAHTPWLDTDTPPSALASLLAPYPDAGMLAYPVSTAVNSPRNEGAELVTPLAPQ